MFFSDANERENQKQQQSTVISNKLTIHATKSRLSCIS